MRRNLALLNWSMVPAAGILVLLLVLALLRLARRGESLDGPGLVNPLAPPHTSAEQVRRFFGWPRHVPDLPLTNVRNPFFTLAIQAAPPPAPPPPPPKTRTVELTYRGFFETSASSRRAVVQVADKQVLGGLGDVVVADFRAAEIELRHLTLTNPAGRAVRCPFAKVQPLEIPVP